MAITKLKLMKMSMYKLYCLEAELEHSIKLIHNEIFLRQSNRIKELEEQVSKLKEKK